MAKGDFIFAGPNDSTYTSHDFRKGKREPGDKVAGVTLLFLFVTIKLERKEVTLPGKTGEVESDEKPSTETKEQGVKDQEKGDRKKVCVCTAKITDYSLQGNVYVDKDVLAGDPRLGVTLHELIHLWHHKEAWDRHKGELETLLDGKQYACSDDAKTEIIQDVFAWFTGLFYSDQTTEEEHTQIYEKALEKGIPPGTPEKKAIDGIFGKEKLDANGKAAKPDKDLPIPGRFSSRVIATWDGSCTK